MPLMGLTSPASLVSTAVTGNAEVLAMLCLVQAADPGTPFIYAPALAVMEPRSGRFGGGAAELALLGAATTEMARHYGLPVEASAGGTDHHVPGIQAAFERALGWTLPALAWPDLLVGPGLLGGSLVLSLEQLLLDVEVFRRLRRLHRGVGSPSALTEARLQDEIEPGVSFVASTATRDALRAGEWQVSDLGVHGTFESWDEAGRPELLEEVRERASSLVAAHRPLPLDPAVERELERIESRAHASVGRAPAGQPETAR
jgi:trimethylamine--corrinoid protein Co-methyltransferase